MLEKLKERFPALKEKEELKYHCTFRVGGPADLFYTLSDIEELPQLVQWAEENHVPWFVFGRGSNIVFSDKGFRGLIIKNSSREIELRQDARGEKTMLYVDSGALLAEVIRKALECALAGLEPLAGIPGSIGGAVFGNAGVPGTDIGAFVTEISAFDIEKGIHDYSREQLRFGYRTSALKQMYVETGSAPVILRVWLQLKRGDVEKALRDFKAADEARRAKQPAGMSAGSFFENPSCDKPAGMLLDQAGCKGMRVNGAVIHEKHANFFSNSGNATAKDLIALAKKAQQKAFETHKIALQPEVRILDEYGKIISI